MFGIIGKLKAEPGRAEELASILLEGSAEMPGCLSYVVALDAEDGDALWVTEVWESEEAHRASLSLETVHEAIARGRPMIVGFESRVVTAPVGGHGLS